MSMQRLLSFEIGDERGSEELQAPCDASHGFDVLIRIVHAHGLPTADWWNGLADPYCLLAVHAGEQCIQYRTRTVLKDLNPTFDEFLEVGNLPAGACLKAEVWDKDLLTPDDVMGAAAWRFEPAAPNGRLPVRLPLAHPSRKQSSAGELKLEVHHRPSRAPGTPRLLGPVRFRQQFSPVSGLLMGRWNDDNTLAYSTSKLFLVHIEDVFEGVSFPWNRKHAAAARIYQSPVLLSGVRTQHATLYATHLGRCRCGVLGDHNSLFALFHCGVRGGQRRYFTYSLLADSFRCSETGAGFATDMMSKHAMHAGGAEEVLYAGEFCILPDDTAPGGHRLVLDNNSGTFAPSAAHLPTLARLFAANFPELRIETVPVGDPRLDEYHRQCPSRSKLSAAAAAAAVAEEPGGAAQPANGTPPLEPQQLVSPTQCTKLLRRGARQKGGLVVDLSGAEPPLQGVLHGQFRLEASEVAALMEEHGLGEDELLARLIQPAAQQARPPISAYHVGAVGLGASGCLYVGVNLEFARLPLYNSVHAEQFLLVNALHHGETEIRRLAVSAAPCGHCRQFYSELACAETVRFTFGGGTYSLGQLLPMRFKPADLLPAPAPPLLLQPQNNAIQLTGAARAALRERGGDAAFARAAAEALAEATGSYAPYSRCPAGAAIVTGEGHVYSGGYIESAAYNPSLPPLQTAIVDAVIDGMPCYTEATEVVLVELAGGAVQHAPTTRVILEQIAPQARLTVLQAEWAAGAEPALS
ncbi:cytidine deaminase 1 [Micractinium conductrix]|uniref:Cytidine deaminase 1 n=1 Tax=Micractinium conductrix TaxID=554055 RepID=A0A2P6V2C5_9CHLO|nr:cytidine deaminase 1 [Micractinium conductrix]|eukprot:PSC68243.1 cytidine deaminase 1 [Micractinium conductrix]